MINIMNFKLKLKLISENNRAHTRLQPKMIHDSNIEITELKYCAMEVTKIKGINNA